MKDKTKKVLKTIGLVVLSLLATLGVVLGGLLIGEMGKGNTKPVLMEQERTSFRSPVRRMPNLNGADNLFQGSNIIPHLYCDTSTAYKDDTSDTYYTYVEKGYYWYNSYPAGAHFLYGDFSLLSWLGNTASENYSAQSYPVDTIMVNVGNAVEGGAYVYIPSGYYFLASTRSGNLPYLTLVDTLSVPSSSRITFGDNWYPLKIFGDNVTSGGSYLIMDEATLEHTYNGGYTSTLAVLFRYQGVVYDRIRFMCTNLNGLGKPYVDESGTIQHPDRPSSNSIFVLESVTFYSSWLTGDDANYLKVLSAQHSDSPSTDRNNNVFYPYLGKTQWLTQGRTIEILDEIDTNVYTSGRWQGYNALQVLQFISSYYSDGSSLAVADGQSALELLTTTFASVAPILGISLFPNITIGLLIFLPLVAGIIVLIIKAVKK